MEKDSDAKERVDELVAGGKQAQVLVKDDEIAENLHGNDSKVLELLNEEGANYSFKGIMRRLGIHQQSLSRALRRLEEMGLVEKTDVGYRLRAGEMAAGAQHVAKGREYMQLLQTVIPVEVRPKEIVRALVGRWFKGLRWIGLIESVTGFTLQWSSEDGSFQINLRMISDYVVIETNASAQQEKLQAMAGSYAIFEQITKALQERVAPSNSYLINRWPANN